MNNEQNLNAGTSASMDTKPLVIGSYVRPKENMQHIQLTKAKTYKVLNVIHGSYQIENDHGFIDYYSQDLFQT